MSPRVTKLTKDSCLIPAVVDPSLWNAGFSFAKSTIFVFGRIPSSTETIIFFSTPVLGSTNFENKYH